MERDWDAEWAEISEELQQAMAAFQNARQQGDRPPTDDASRRHGMAYNRRLAYIRERMRADPVWPDPDNLKSLQG